MNVPSPLPRGKSRPNRTTRQGSFMSTKQIKTQAASERAISVADLYGQINLTGYIVGMDDYHLMVVVTGGQFFHRLNSQGQGTKPAVYETVLVHKGSVPAILLHTDKVLSNENDPVQEAVNRVGRSFISACQRQDSTTEGATAP